MNIKQIIRIVLISFVLFSIFTIIKKETTKIEVVEETKTNETKTVAYYFHGNKRCKTCNTIENYTKEVILQNFANELKSKDLEFKIINIDKSENEHFIEDFQLTTKSVVVAKIVNGKITDWKNLDKVWQLVGNKVEFQNYIIIETKKVFEA